MAPLLSSYYKNSAGPNIQMPHPIIGFVNYSRMLGLFTVLPCSPAELTHKLIPCNDVAGFSCNLILLAICSSIFRKMCKNVYSGT
jgi:hypothetical protein